MAKKKTTKKATKKKGTTKKKAKKTAASKSPATKKASRTKAPTTRKAKKTTTKAQPVAPEPEPIEEQPKLVTKLSDEELREFKTLLLEKRAELVGNVTHLSKGALHDPDSEGGGNLSTMPIHMADMGTDNWEQEFSLSLMETEQQLVREIDAALARIEDKSYGICEATHKPISKKRLYAKPWARYCIEYARQKELGRFH